MDLGYQKIDKYDEACVAEMAEHYKAIIKLLGENPEREGLLKSPERIAKAMLFFTNGYDLNPEDILRSAMFHEDYKQMVVVKDIELYSLCEHHMVPFVGKAHVAYIPNSQRYYRGPQQDTACGRCLCPPPAGAGAPHQTNQRLHPEGPQSPRRGRRY